MEWTKVNSIEELEDFTFNDFGLKSQVINALTSGPVVLETDKSDVVTDYTRYTNEALLDKINEVESTLSCLKEVCSQVTDRLKSWIDN